MSDKPEYLQAASVEDLLNKAAMFGLYFSSRFDRLGRPNVFDKSAPSFTGREIRDELLRRFAALEAERDALRSFANAHENWEAALLNDDQAWGERSLPCLTQTLWDAALGLQDMRNKALGKFETTEAPGHDE